MTTNLLPPLADIIADTFPPVVSFPQATCLVNDVCCGPVVSTGKYERAIVPSAVTSYGWGDIYLELLAAGYRAVEARDKEGPVLLYTTLTDKDFREWEAENNKSASSKTAAKEPAPPTN